MKKKFFFFRRGSPGQVMVKNGLARAKNGDQDNSSNFDPIDLKF